MKPTLNFISAGRMVLALLCLGMAGCQTHSSKTQLGGGYVEINHPTHTFLPGENPPRISLAHVDSAGQFTTVWPSLYSANEAVNGRVAVFVAEKSFVNQGQASIHPRLFAVESPGLPMDITEEVLWRWSKANGKNLTKTFERFSLATPEATDGGLAIHLEFWPGGYLEDADWPETGDLKLAWSEVSEIIRSIESKGVRQKDLRWHTPYLAEKF